MLLFANQNLFLNATPENFSYTEFKNFKERIESKGHFSECTKANLQKLVDDMIKLNYAEFNEMSLYILWNSIPQDSKGKFISLFLRWAAITKDDEMYKALCESNFDEATPIAPFSITSNNYKTFMK